MDIYELQDTLRTIIEEDRDSAPRFPPMIAIPPFQAEQAENGDIDGECIVVGVAQENISTPLGEDPQYCFIALVSDGDGTIWPKAIMAAQRDSLPYTTTSSAAAPLKTTS